MKNVCKFVQFLHGTMQNLLLALSKTFQTGFKIRICNQETVKLTYREKKLKVNRKNDSVCPALTRPSHFQRGEEDRKKL